MTGTVRSRGRREALGIASFDLPDEDGGTVPAETIQRAHVATLAFEFASVASTAAMSAMIGADATGDAG